MKKSILSIVAAAALLAGASSANAQTYTQEQTATVDSQTLLSRFCRRYPSSQVCQSPVTQVPEIDASSGTQALALVLGLGLLSAEALRRRRRSVPTR
jgi:DMSO reductase anchor subunit